MRITVDTEKDSAETLRKAANFILEFANKGERYSSSQVEPNDLPNPSFMFSDDDNDSRPPKSSSGDNSVNIIPY